MSLFVYITESCKGDAHRYALSDEIQRFKEKVEKSQATSQFDPFPPPYLVKKKLGGRQGRLIADLRTVGDHAVVVFLAIMIRGDRAYEDHFGPDPVAYGNQHFKHLVEAGELESYINERTRVEPPPAKPNPSAEEFAFLSGAFAHRQTAAEEDTVKTDSMLKPENSDWFFRSEIRFLTKRRIHEHHIRQHQAFLAGVPARCSRRKTEAPRFSTRVGVGR